MPADADGYLHVAQIRQDEKSDELYFYGTYLTENGIETLCALGFTGGDLTEVLLGTEDGTSYRAIHPDNFTGEVEVMPFETVQVFLSAMQIPLSKKTILLNKDTVKSVKIVRTDLAEIDDLRSNEPADSEPEISRSIAIRDIYGHETEYPVFRPGWNKYKSEWYYADENGVPVKGWLNDNGSRYYMDPETGAMQTGWKLIDGKKYYFIDERCANYYTAVSASMATGLKTISGKQYYFYNNGVLRADQ